MTTPTQPMIDAVPTSSEVYEDLIRRVTDIDNAHRSIAEKAG